MMKSAQVTGGRREEQGGRERRIEGGRGRRGRENSR